MLIILLLAAMGLLPAAGEGEWSLVPPAPGGLASAEEYRNAAGCPRVPTLGTRSKRNGDQVISWHVIEADGRILKEYPPGQHVAVTGQGRYRDVAWLGVDSLGGALRISTRGETRPGRVDGRIGRDGAPLAVPPPPVPADSLVSEADLDGRLGAVMIDDEGWVWLGDGGRWLRSGTQLERSSDRLQVLAVWPSASGVDATLYRRVNVYNKGLMLLRWRAGEEQVASGHLFNSEIRNVGWSPCVVRDGHGRLLVSARDSTGGGRLQWMLAADSPLPPAEAPVHTRGFEGEEGVQFVLGAGVRYVMWTGRATAPKSEAEVSYRIDSSTFQAYQAEARLGRTDFALCYLRNRLAERIGEEAGEGGRRTSEILLGAVDVTGLLGERNSLRLSAEQGQLSGIATFTGFTPTAEAGSAGYTVSTPAESVSFRSRYEAYRLSWIHYRGLQIGLEYQRFALPALAAYAGMKPTGDGEVMAYAEFDPGNRIEMYNLVVGYDHLTYLRRYETRACEPYIQVEVGLGGGPTAIPAAASARALQATGKHRVEGGEWNLGAGGGIEVGWVWMERSKLLRGLGLVAQVGYRLRGWYISSIGGDEERKTEGKSAEEVAQMRDTLHYSFERWDMIHGPFASLSLVW